MKKKSQCMMTVYSCKDKISYEDPLFIYAKDKKFAVPMFTVIIIIIIIIIMTGLV
jgi:hypothetical protein